MIRFNSIKTPALLACLVLFAAQVRAADEPKDVAVAFAKTIKSGDKKAAHDLCVGTPEQIKTIDTLIDMMSTILKFKDACDKKFGADNLLSKNMAGGMPDIAVEAAKAEYKVEGDTATAVDKAKPDEKNPMKLKKTDGTWKVDLASMGDDAAQAAQAAPMMKIMAETTEEINAGKYKTVEEAAVAFGTKMQAPKK